MYPKEYYNETNLKRCILCLDFKENYYEQNKVREKAGDVLGETKNITSFFYVISEEHLMFYVLTITYVEQAQTHPLQL